MSHGRNGLLQESSPSPERYAASYSGASMLLVELLAKRIHSREWEYKLAPTIVYFIASGEYGIALGIADRFESRKPEPWPTRLFKSNLHSSSRTPDLVP